MDVTGQTRAGNPAVTSDETVALALSFMDVVYVVRPGNDNEALRYSLRSLKNLPHRRVMIVGNCPSWVKDTGYFPVDQANKPDQENSNNNLRIAADSPFLSDDFVFMNDDFIVMQPTDELPPLHQGSLNNRIDGYKTGDRYHQAYSLIATRQELRSLIPRKQLFSYELHIPMVFNKHKLKTMFRYWMHNTTRPLASLRPRTMYGNLYSIGGTEASDVKGVKNASSQFISTTSGFNGADAATVRSVFRDPGRYERS